MNDINKFKANTQFHLFTTIWNGKSQTYLTLEQILDLILNPQEGDGGLVRIPSISTPQGTEYFIFKRETFVGIMAVDMTSAPAIVAPTDKDRMSIHKDRH